MKYTLIDRDKVPLPASGSMSERRRQSEKIIADLIPGKAAEITLGPKDTPRGVKASLTRAAKRQNRQIRSWEIDGVVYTELVHGSAVEEKRPFGRGE